MLSNHVESTKIKKRKRDYVEDVSYRTKKKSIIIKSKWKFCFNVSCIIAISCIFFGIFAIIVSQYQYFKLIGVPILLSWGSAAAIFSLLTILLFLVSYDVLTCLRGSCCKRNCTIIDKKILFHRISGFLILGYAFLHTIGHLTGSIRTVAFGDLEKVNEVFMKKKFDRHYSYAHLLFFSVPGATGCLLWFFFLLMTITSLKCTW